MKVEPILIATTMDGAPSVTRRCSTVPERGQEAPPPGTTCSNAHGISRPWYCMRPATRVLNGKPYCTQHYNRRVRFLAERA